MNKLKKVGLTALATSLVASSAYAGELSVSGSASLNYSSVDTASAVNPWTMGDSVTFSGGGELDNGMTLAVSYELDNSGGGHPLYDDYKLTLGLGDGLGALTFSGDSVNAGGIDTVKDIIPTAYTAVYEGTNGVDNGIATLSGRSTTSMWGYNYSAGGLMLSLGYNKINSSGTSNDAESSIGVKYDALEGLTLVAGRYDDGDVAESDTLGIKYTMGSVTAGYQVTDINYDAAATNDQSAKHYGISFAVNENMSVSVGKQDVDIETASNDEENTGVSASYTMGSITLGGAMNKVENVGGAAGSDAKVSILNASFAF